MENKILRAQICLQNINKPNFLWSRFWPQLYWKPCSRESHECAFAQKCCTFNKFPPSARWVPGSGMCHLPAERLQDIQSILEGRDRTWGVAGWEIPAQQQWGCQGCPKSCCSLAAPRCWPAASRHRQWIVCRWLWAPWKSFLFLWIKGKQIIFPCFMWNHLFGCDFASSSRGALPLHAPRTWQWQLNAQWLNSGLLHPTPAV